MSIAIQRNGTALPYTLIAPIGGLNTRDALSNMPETDAVKLDNWFPTTSGVRSRKGYISFCTGLVDDVETLVEYHAAGTQDLIAAADDTIYEISSGTASSLGSGFSNARWQAVNFNGYLNLVNGADDPQNYDGSTLTSAGWTGSGLTPTNLVGIHAFKNRLYFWENDSQNFWYGGVNAVTGTLTKFPLSRVGQKGGNLIAIKSITRDGGAGSDDVIAFFMSSGTVIVYNGDDPGDATRWSLQGIYTIGEPVSIRSLVEIKGDVLIATKADVVSLLQVMSEGGFNNSPSKLSGAVASDAITYGNNYGWQMILYPKGNMALLNVPIAANSRYIQYVQNTITGAFCRFTGMNARCWGIFNGDLYFGGDGVVYKADTGYDDNGEKIAIDAISAYSPLGRSTQKRVARYRPVIKATGTINLTVGIGYDYRNVSVTQVTTATQSGSLWDVAMWDVSFWAPEEDVKLDSFVAGGIGAVAALRMAASIDGNQVEWYRTDLTYVPLRSF